MRRSYDKCQNVISSCETYIGPKSLEFYLLFIDEIIVYLTTNSPRRRRLSEAIPET